jgi:hypothetical protein
VSEREREGEGEGERGSVGTTYSPFRTFAFYFILGSEESTMIM